MVAKLDNASPLDGATLAQLQEQKLALQERTSRRHGRLSTVFKAIALAIVVLAGAGLYQRTSRQTSMASSYSSTDSDLPWQVHDEI